MAKITNMDITINQLMAIFIIVFSLQERITGFPYEYYGSNGYNPLQYQNYYGNRFGNNRFYRSQRIMQNRRRVPRIGLRVADQCNPNPQDLVSNENMPDDSDVQVVMVDDPMILILPECNGTTTTCMSPVMQNRYY